MTHAIRSTRWKLNGKTGQLSPVGERDFVPSLDELIDTSKLACTERRLDVRHPVVEPHLSNVVEPLPVLRAANDAVRPEAPKPSHELFIVGCHHTALASRDRLDRVRRETAHVAMRAVANRAIRCPRAERVSGILNHRASASTEPSEVDGQTGVMHGHHGGNVVGYEREVDVPRGGLDIHDRGLRSYVAGAVGTGHERQRGRHDSVAWPETGRGRSAVQGRRA